VRRGLVAVVGLALVAGPVPALAGPTDPDDAVHTVRVGSAYAKVAAHHAELGDKLVHRTWSIDGGSVETIGLTGPDGRQWAAPGPDFTVTFGIDGVSTSSATGWSLASVKPVKTRNAVGVDFVYAPLDAALAPAVTLERKVRLQSGRSTMSVTSTLHSLLPLRIPSYTLDQVTPAKPGLPAEVIRYREGSDWRNDYRVISHPSGSFDAEGETLRRGGDSGYFLVSQRRGGLASRAQHTSTGADAVGVDWARDLFDAGPLITDPPNYNTVGNPAYPVPLRARLVRPGETLQLGTAWTGTYAGPAGAGQNSAAAAFVAAFPWHVDRTIGANSFHPWSHGPDMSDLNLRKQIDAAKRLGVERYMLDDQWQGGPGGESGDWRFDPVRYPDRDHDGMPDFITYLHDKGMQLGLWMSPVEFHMDSVTYAQHPTWGCLPLGDISAQVPDDAGLGAWDVTNPDFQDYLVGVVDRLVNTYDVRELKFDFMAWLDCGTRDYADYEDAFVAMVQRMQRRHPRVTFELDETNDQRSWPFESEALGPSWFDNNHDHDGVDQVSGLLHDLWSAAPWMPTQTLGLGSFDGDALEAGRSAELLMPLALLSHITFWTDFTKLTTRQQRRIKWWNHWYAAHRDGIGPLEYALTTQDPAKGNWLVLEPWRGKSGYVFAFRKKGPASIRVRLLGVRSSSAYIVSDAHTAEIVRRATGRELRHGLRIDVPKAWTARVLRIAPA
jgi:hypothetical protein